MILNCRGDKIEINKDIIDVSCEDSFLKTNYELDAKEIYVNCSKDKMHILLDLLPDGNTDDEFILNMAKFMGFSGITKIIKEEIIVPDNKVDTKDYLANQFTYMKLLECISRKDRDTDKKYMSDYISIFTKTVSEMNKKTNCNDFNFYCKNLDYYLKNSFIDYGKIKPWEIFISYSKITADFCRLSLNHKKNIINILEDICKMP
jgi:hypothetical protein